jgi:hypothetical protein
MTQERLAAVIDQPEVHRRVLGGYQGSYSLGVTRDPEAPGQAAIRLRIQGHNVEIPDRVLIDSELIRVIKHFGFETPRPLAARR